jgi:hypothetical protein
MQRVYAICFMAIAAIWGLYALSRYTEGREKWEATKPEDRPDWLRHKTPENRTQWLVWAIISGVIIAVGLATQIL